MDFADVMQEYLNNSDPDLNIPLSKIFNWFFEKGRESNSQKADECERRTFRYGEENKILRDAMGTTADSYASGMRHAAQIIKEHRLECWEVVIAKIEAEADSI